MQPFEEKIREACFNLSITLMWEKDTATIEEIENSMDELNQMADTFFNTSKFYLENIEALEGNYQTMIRAIKYIEEVHAIPPLRGNSAWFDYTLATLVELACPNSRLAKNNLDFLKDIENGIKDYRDNSFDSDEI